MQTVSECLLNQCFAFLTTIPGLHLGMCIHRQLKQKFLQKYLFLFCVMHFTIFHSIPLNNTDHDPPH